MTVRNMGDGKSAAESSKMHSIEDLIAEQPNFHAWPDGRPANWSVANDVLRFIHQSIVPGMQTLETGSGRTTVVFALAGAHHTCISPNREETERIRHYLARHGIKDTIRFIHDSSDVVLPAGKDIPEVLDFVLIDGAHRFPMAVIDWHYSERRVRVGGIVAVDDYPMPSVRVLHDFLMGEDEWQLTKKFMRTSFFQRVHETVSVWDWADQNMNKPPSKENNWFRRLWKRPD